LEAAIPFGTTYQTTQIGNRSLGWIRDIAVDTKPFFAYIGPHAPHYPAEPAPWYKDAFPDIKIPITPNYNVSSPDKAQMVRFFVALFC
jgi:N-acetylglucosamine-6-sulfatase